MVTILSLEEIRERKNELGYSNTQLSKLSGIPIGTLNKILSGETKKPRYEAMHALENILKEPIINYGIGESQPNMLREETSGYGIKKTCKTIADYYALPEDIRVELIDGIFYDMSAPSIVHQRIIGDIFFQIKTYIDKKDGKCVPMLAPIDVRLNKDDYTMVQPDLLIVCNKDKITDIRIEGAPDFVIEVVSQTSASRDYIQKVSRYMESGVREYWIVDPLKKRVMVYDFENDAVPYVQGLEGNLGINIYNNDLQINLDRIKVII